MKKNIVLALFLCVALFLSGCSEKEEDIPFHSEETEEKPPGITPENAADYVIDTLKEPTTMAGYFKNDFNQEYEVKGNTALIEAFSEILGSSETWEDADMGDLTEAPATEVYLYNDDHHISFLPYENYTYIEIVAKGQPYAFRTNVFYDEAFISLFEKYL